MENKQDFLDNLYKSFKTFHTKSYLPQTDKLYQDGWVIDREERDAILKVLDLLEDCGAE